MSAVKPTIPADVADLIEHIRPCYAGHTGADEQILAYVLNTIQTESGPAKTLRKIPFHTLLQALANGYERELTEEERTIRKIRKRYAEERANFGHDDDYTAGFAAGFTHGLEFMRDELRLDIELDEGAAYWIGAHSSEG